MEQTQSVNARLMKKWKPVLEHKSLPPISDMNRMQVTAAILENTENSLKKEGGVVQSSLISESVGQTNHAGQAAGYDPVMISLIRRSVPNLLAYDVCGVQPMNGPTGLIFAMRSNIHTDAANNEVKSETFFNEPDSSFSGTGSQANDTGDVANTLTTGTGMDTAVGEQLGSLANNHFQEVSFEIDKVSVTAKTRALKAEYSSELAQDLQNIHGLDAETELSNILSTELLSEINREVVRTIYTSAVSGAQSGVASAGTFNLDVDGNGRWSVEKFKGLMFQVEREANAIGKQTRRGRGNIVICSSDVASALQMAGILDHTPALNSNNLNVDDTGNTFAGVLNGRYRVYIDPYADESSNYLVVGYKGSRTFDAGLFYCPYVPLQMVRAVGENTFQSKIGFKTRYGMVANPFARGVPHTHPDATQGIIANNTNKYYRRVGVTNLM